MYHERLWLEVVTPMGKSSNDCIILFIISGVVEFGATQIPTKVSQGSFGLDGDYRHANIASITFNFKKQIKVGKSQDRS